MKMDSSTAVQWSIRTRKCRKSNAKRAGKGESGLLSSKKGVFKTLSSQGCNLIWEADSIEMSGGKKMNSRIKDGDKKRGQI